MIILLSGKPGSGVSTVINTITNLIYLAKKGKLHEFTTQHTTMPRAASVNSWFIWSITSFFSVKGFIEFNNGADCIVTNVYTPKEVEDLMWSGGMRNISIRIKRITEGSKVYWFDTDVSKFAEGANSGVYTVIKTGHETAAIVNDVGTEYSVPYSELEEYTPEHNYNKGLDNYKGFNHYIINKGTVEELVANVKYILAQEGLLYGIEPGKRTAIEESN